MTSNDRGNINRLYNEERYSFTSIGRLYGVSRQRIHQIIKGYKSFSSNGLSYKDANLIMGNICKKCKEIGGIHIHHIDRNSKNNRPNNLIPLCVKCHKEIHAGEKRDTRKKK